MVIPVAYIDPGSGAMLLQVLIAVIVGAGVVFRQTLAGILRRLAFWKRTGDEAVEDTEAGKGA